MISLANKLVLITGASGGFGQALTRLLLREGCALILADLSRDQIIAAADAAARSVGNTSGRILGFVPADLGTAEGAVELHSAVRRISSQIDVLVNNAGIGILGPIDQIPPEKWERVIQVNLLAPMRLTQLFLPSMLARRSGHVVNICSAASLVGGPRLSVYSASKFGLRGFSESLARDVRSQGVAVTAIYPFFSRTPILQSEQFGVAGRPATLPKSVVSDPNKIMAALVRGIKRRQLHVYPDPIARGIDLMRRLGG